MALSVICANSSRVRQQVFHKIHLSTHTRASLGDPPKGTAREEQHGKEIYPRYTHTPTSEHTPNCTHLSTHTIIHLPQNTHQNTPTSVRTPKYTHLSTHTKINTHLSAHTKIHSPKNTHACKPAWQWACQPRREAPEGNSNVEQHGSVGGSDSTDFSTRLSTQLVLN